MLGNDSINDVDDGGLVVGRYGLQGPKPFQQGERRNGPIVGLLPGQQVVHGDAERGCQQRQLFDGRGMEACFVFVEVGGSHAQLAGQFLHGPAMRLAQVLDALSKGLSEDGIGGEGWHDAGEHRGSPSWGLTDVNITDIK